MGIRRVGVCLKPDQPQAEPVVRALRAWLAERGIDVAADAQCAPWCGVEASSPSALAEGCDLLVSLGGDGTLLSVARAVGTRAVPILGVNLGTLGFLTEVSVDEMLDVLAGVLDGRATLVSRMRLSVLVRRDGREVAQYQALNEAVVAKNALSRMIDIEVAADDLAVTTYHGDGLIVATPTGSTAYSLSAGGPLVLPGTGVIVLTPICPHSLAQRPLVLPQASRVDATVRTRGSDVSLTVDGQQGLALEDGDRVTVTRSPHPVEVVASPVRSRFDILRTKLHWGER
ncbi:MAG: NAD(+)/NADH kinase [Myxococcota bacterium]|nr:NAD(+)/NADH kinase [Myxococcales bacterium]